ncbi:MAG: hypothetical protein KJ063_17400 [Anaerolineae bacterium]|nr:hypothetical protein [Anaerolineae bacterium]
MDERLQQAIDAIRTNDKAKAQQLLAQFLKSNPNHPQGWFLLSQVVADKKQQVAFLNKTLTLDPEHRQARQKLAALGEAAPELPPADDGPVATQSSQPVSQGVVDFAEQAEARTIPPWMAGQVTHEVEDAAADEFPSQISQTSPSHHADIPDWLQESPEEDETPEELLSEKADEAVAATAPALTKPAEKAATTSKVAKPVTVDKGMESLPWSFYLLLLFALIIVIAILYQVVSLF